MLSFQIAKLVEEVTEGISDNNAFVGAVQLLAEPIVEVVDALQGIGTNTNNSGYANSLHSILTSFYDRKASILPRKFYTDLESVHEALSNFQKNLETPSEYIDSLIANIDVFAEIFGIYLATPNASNAAPLAIEAPRLAQRFYDFKKSFHLFEGMIRRIPSRQIEGSVFTIVLAGEFDFKSFVARLSAISSMYSELCELLNISEVDDPLEIQMIESGSLFAKLAGSATVIALMVQFIHSTATYAYDNYTVEGRIKAIPTKVESLDAVIGLTQKLKAAGVDTKEMDVHVSKSAHAIAKDLNTLLEGQPSIILNGLEISGTNEGPRKQVAYQNAPRLSGIIKP